jgi:GMP synthase (glutamine-hydrolysing)
MPERFMAQMGHKDRATRVGDGVPNLAASERSPYQALRIPGKPIWATQFHPELDRETNLDRYRYYLEGYSVYLDDEERSQAFARFQEGPESARLLRAFLDLVFD